MRGRQQFSTLVVCGAGAGDGFPRYNQCVANFEPQPLLETWQRADNRVRVSDGAIVATKVQFEARGDVRGVVRLGPESGAGFFRHFQLAVGAARIDEFDFIANSYLRQPLTTDWKDRFSLR